MKQFNGRNIDPFHAVNLYHLRSYEHGWPQVPKKEPVQPATVQVQ